MKRKATVFSESQLKAIEACKSGNNVLITGPAGTGKTFLLNHLIAWAKEKYGRTRVGITATTGKAADAISGSTIHSFTGIGLGTGTVNDLYKSIKSKNKKKKLDNWLNASILFVDEVSMLSDQLLEKLDFLGQKIRKSKAPFGGIQIIGCGDFLQLPPIEGELAINSPRFDTIFPVQIVLIEIFRQASDKAFLDLLSGLRVGKLDEESEALLRATESTPAGEYTTKLYPLRKQVDAENLKHLDLIDSPVHSYKAVDHSSNNTTPESNQWFFKSCIAQEKLDLKLGAKVMLIANLDFETGLVNGVCGTVVRFVETQPTSKSFSKYFKIEYPVVLFENGVEKLMTPHEWSYEVLGKVQATRNQVPLLLAWALSIHKAQGMTLEHVEVDMAHIFEAGMAYVGISRATTLKGLCIKHFDPKRITANKDAINFYSKCQK